MMKKLGKQSIAVAVNNEAQFSVVKDLGFDFCQGEYTGKIIKKK